MSQDHGLSPTLTFSKVGQPKVVPPWVLRGKSASVTVHRDDASHGQSRSGQSSRDMDHTSDEGGAGRAGAAEERNGLNHGVQEELKSRKAVAVRVKVKVWQKERVLHLRYGIRRDHCQFEEQGRTLCVLVPLLPCPSLQTFWPVRGF